MRHREFAKDLFNTCRRVAVLFAAAALAVATPAAAGTTYNVSTVAGLQAVIATVNLGTGGDTIVLASGVYQLTSTLSIEQDVTIQGDPLAPTVLDGGSLFTILNVRANNISIQNLTLQNGSPAISYEGSGVFSGTGVTITGSNTGFYPGDSGGVTFFTNSTVANNGTGIEISCAELHLTNVTVSNNDVGIYFNYPCGEQMQIANSLIVANLQDCGGGGGFAPVGDASFDSDGSCVAAGFGPGLTTVWSNLGLGGLAANGGPTMTEAILATSPAVNAGNNTVCPPTDQRGFFRFDGACDIGAYEYGAGSTPFGSNISVSPAPGVTVTFSNVTTAGYTSGSTAAVGPAPSGSFTILPGFGYLSIDTTATFSGPVKIAIQYDLASLGIMPVLEPTLQLWHFNCQSTPCVWETINDLSVVPNPDTTTHTIYGVTSSFSVFALGLGTQPSTQPPIVSCVGTALSPKPVGTSAGMCNAPADNTNGVAGTCADGGGGLASCTFDGQPSEFLAPGTYSVVVQGVANDGSSAQCTSYIQVADMEKPSITCPAPETIECTGQTTPLTLNASSADNCGVMSSGCSASSFPLGATAASCWATDAAGNTASCNTTVTVVDTQPPAIGSVTATPNVLWPPNDKMVTVSVAALASDACSGGDTTCRITSVTNHESDFTITGPLTVKLRAERSGHGTGRTYTITVQCTDLSGNSTVKSATVVVPHDMRGDKDRDDGKKEKDKDKDGR